MNSFENLVAALNLVNEDLLSSDEEIPFGEQEGYCLPPIKKVVYDEANGTAIHWMDGTNTHVRCGQGECFDRYGGFMAAVCKKLFGSTSAAKKVMNSHDAKLIAEARQKEIEKNRAEQHQREIRNVTREIKKEVRRQRIEKIAKLVLNGELNMDPENMLRLIESGDEP